MEIASNVYRVSVGQVAFVGVYAPNVYLVVGDDRAAFIDTAYGKDEEVDAQLKLWESQGRREIAAIVLTHRHADHIGGVLRLHDCTGGPVTCGSAEREAIEGTLDGLQVDRVVDDGESLGLGNATLEFIHTPGHTVGSVCVYYREEGVLFTGDTILGSGTTVVSPDHGDMALYIESLRKLLRYDARIICPGHGPIVNQPQAKIQGLIEHRLERERQILDLLQEGQDTIEELFIAIYPELDRRLHDTARSQIRSHLIKLEREGKVRALQDRFNLK